MADPRRPVEDEAAKPHPQTHNSELEREERRLERLRLVKTERWPAAKPPVPASQPKDAA